MNKQQPVQLYVIDDPESSPAPASPSTAPSRPVDATPVPAPVAAADEEQLDRRGDGEVSQREAVGVVHQVIDPINSEPIAPEQSTLLRRESRREEQACADLFASLDAKPPFWESWLRSSGLTAAVVLLAVLLLVFLLSQVTQLLVQLSAWPTVLRPLGYGSVGLLCTAAAVAAGRLALMYLRLRRNPALRTDALYRVAARQRIRAAGTRRAFDQVYQHLQPLLASYPLHDKAFGNRLRACGAAASQVDLLAVVQQRLLKAQGGKEAWIAEFNKQFLSILDDIAARRLRRAAFSAAKLTALSPRGSIDALIMSALALELVADLCAIYNLRASRVDTVRILGTLIFHAGVSSQLEDLSHGVAADLFYSLHSDTTWFTALIGKVAAPLTGGIADGMLNGSLIYRLGRVTIRALRPLQM
jgi:uncharacterized membrane protein YcjF (UPF0283 family)